MTDNHKLKGHTTTIRAGVDWGSSSLRAYRFDGTEIIDTLSRPMGIKFVPDAIHGQGNKFESVLFDLIGDWLKPGDGVLLSGMITSVNGWIETPYLECPVSCPAIASQLVRSEAKGINLYFLPGVCQREPQADVMRGEELQLLGISGDHSAGLIVMPGTHSKWAFVEADTLISFRTIVTGELFEALLNHTLVGQLSAGTQAHRPSFISGVEKGYASHLIIGDLFTCRAGVLLGRLEPAHVHSYLSGLLIGHEIREGLSLPDSRADSSQQRMHKATDKRVITLIGSETLCDRYTLAMQHLGVTVTQVNTSDNGDSTDAAARGFTLLAKTF